MSGNVCFAMAPQEEDEGVLLDFAMVMLNNFRAQGLSFNLENLIKLEDAVGVQEMPAEKMSMHNWSTSSSMMQCLRGMQ